MSINLRNITTHQRMQGAHSRSQNHTEERSGSLLEVRADRPLLCGGGQSRLRSRPHKGSLHIFIKLLYNIIHWSVHPGGRHSIWADVRDRGRMNITKLHKFMMKAGLNIFDSMPPLFNTQHTRTKRRSVKHPTTEACMRVS